MLDMSISAAQASSLSQVQTQFEVGMRVAKKAQDVSKQQGDAALSLLQAAANVQKQAVAQFTGIGSNIDVTA